MQAIRVRLITLLFDLPQGWCNEDLVFHLFVQSHQGAILFKALGGGISVPWAHFFSIFFFSYFSMKTYRLIIGIVSKRQF